MTRNIWFGMIIILAFLAGAFCASTSFSEDSADTDALIQVISQDSEAENVMWESENHAEQICITNAIYGYIRPNVRLSAVGNIAFHLRENIRRRGSQLLLFVVFFCMVFKHASGRMRSFLFICMIFISYLQIQLKTLHRRDGKKRYLSFSY